MKVSKKFIVSLMASAMILFTGCTKDEPQLEEAIQPDGQQELTEDDILEASEEAAEQAMDQMDEEYAQQQQQEQEETASDDEVSVEDTGSIAMDEAAEIPEPTYADETDLSYSEDNSMEVADNEDDEMDMSSEDDVATPAMPVEEPEESMAKTSKPSYNASPASSDEYVVQPGDTLSIIAKKLYNDSARWQELASMNNLSGSQTIYPGDKITFDSGDSHASSFTNNLENTRKTVTVQKGDTLSSISQQLFNDGTAWNYLYQLNAEQISNPDKIYVGQVLNYYNPTETMMTH